MNDLPRIALSIRQPWAWMIVRGWKDIENRTWPTKFRGPVLIHAGKGMTREEYEDGRLFYIKLAHWGFPGPVEELPDYEELQRGGIVGTAEITNCVTEWSSSWFVGDYGFVMSGARELPFYPCKGALGFFALEYHGTDGAVPSKLNGQGQDAHATGEARG